jgi:hypothetical protein
MDISDWELVIPAYKVFEFPAVSHGDAMQVRIL